MWTLLVLLSQWGTLKGRTLAKYIDGEPAIVILKGKIMESTMRKMRYRTNDLLQQLRLKGVFDINEIEYAILETDGQLSFLKKSEAQPVTQKHIGLLTSYKGVSTEVIYDGKVIEENLKYINKDENWLLNQIRSHGFGAFEEVFLALVDESNKMFIDGYRDSIKKKQKDVE